jgi:hypothetical protein
MGASDHLGLAVAMPRHGADPRRRPCGAVLGEPLAAEAAPDDDDGLLVHPSAKFAAQALVSSTQQVIARTHARAPNSHYLPFRFRARNGWRVFVDQRRTCGWS